jgi:hypothetical protein
MRDIKFRQAIFKDGKFSHWHYWGYVGYQGAFVAPIEIHQQSSPSTYEIKDSQEYIGVHIGELGLGGAIYEGDILSPIETLADEGNQLVRYCAGAGAAGFMTSGDLQFDECDKIIGNVYKTPELIPEKT